jgi:ribosomal protein S18 acetylase RimI-like enzyme
MEIGSQAEPRQDTAAPPGDRVRSFGDRHPSFGMRLERAIMHADRTIPLPARTMITMTDEFQVVYLGVAHHAEIMDLWQQAGLHIRPEGRDSLAAFTRQMATGVQTPIGLRDGEKLIAVAITTHDSRKGWINRLAVLPAYRHRGLALRLIRLCEEHFQSEGIDIWAALIEDWNRASLALFRRAGYDLAPNITYASRRTGAGV